jgi:hypothetical protein
MIEVMSPLEAAGPLAGRLAAVSIVPLALGIALQLLKLGALGGVWLRIVRAALPGTEIRGRDALVPYLVGTGANAVLPAKAGLATRVVLAHRLIPRATYETLAGTMVAESLLGVPPMLVVLGVAAMTGILPGALGRMPLGAPAWLAAPGAWIVVAAAAVGVAVTAALTAPRARRSAVETAARVRRGMGIMGAGPALRMALLGQAEAWTLRLASTACFLRAFGLTPTPRLVVLVVIAQILATLVPIGPSGVGAQQGLIVVLLTGAASTETALAFGVGMQAAVIVADVLAGLAALAFAGGRRLLRRELGSGLGEAPAGAGGP